MGRYNMPDGVLCTILSYRLLESINGCSVYSMRYRLRLAHGSYLEQRQAHHCHSCTLHPWDHRYVRRYLSESTLCSHLQLSIAASAGYAIATGLVSNLSPDNTSLTSAKHDLILIGPIVATNLLSTGLTFWRAWCALLASDPRRPLTISLA